MGARPGATRSSAFLVIPLSLHGALPALNDLAQTSGVFGSTAARPNPRVLAARVRGGGSMPAIRTLILGYMDTNDTTCVQDSQSKPFMQIGGAGIPVSRVVHFCPVNS